MLNNVNNQQIDDLTRKDMPTLETVGPRSLDFAV